MNRVLVLAPMASELRPVVKYARGRNTEIDDLRAYVGRSGDVEVVIVQLGVGPTSSRRVTEQALRRFDVDQVLVSGIAGGLAPSSTIGTAVIPEVVMDLGSGQRYRSHPMEGVQPTGLVATADRLIVDEQRLADLTALGVVALEMESSGVAQACEAVGVPWTTFRVIGDRPDDHLTDDAVMALLRPDGTSDMFAALRLMLRHPNRIPGMMRLARDSSMAASKAARIALRALGSAS